MLVEILRSRSLKLVINCSRSFAFARRPLSIMNAIKQYVKPLKASQNNNSKSDTTTSNSSSTAAGRVHQDTELYSLPRPRPQTGPFPNSQISSSIPSTTSFYEQGTRLPGGRHVDLLAVKAEVMATYLNQQQLERMWATRSPGEGVVLKKRRNDYAAAPDTLLWDDSGFLDAIKMMNVKV